MIIIFGAGQQGKNILNMYTNEDRDNIVFYDNDRRKWGMEIEGIRVITLERLLELANDVNAKLVLGGTHNSMLAFIKDLQPACEVVKIEDGTEKIVSIDEMEAFPYDNSLEIGERNLNEYIARMEELKERGRMKAYEHARRYVDFKKEHLNLPEISSIEFTNHCNLKCPNCPNAVLKFHKGYISDDVFEAALNYVPPYKTDTIAVHCMGEPLMHPKMLEYLNRLVEIGANICISTNGTLLSKAVFEGLLSCLAKTDKAIIYVSFHTKKSVEKWLEAVSLYESFPANDGITLFGQVLEHNENEAHRWLADLGIKNPFNHPHIRHITSHSWGGNVESRRREYSQIEINNRIRNCYYLRERKIAVMWDGKLRGCCFDSNATQNCGNIFQYDKSDINPKGYELCRFCDPDWITGYQ